MGERNFYIIYKRVTWLIAKYSIILFAVSAIFSLIYLLIDAIDKDYESGYLKPYRQIFCLDDTEYLLKDITQEEFVQKLVALISNDSTAYYACNNEGTIDSLTVNATLLGVNEAKDQGPLCYTVVLFIPFDNYNHYFSLRTYNDFVTVDENFNKYPGKYRLVLKIIDTEPLRLILPRGVGFGYFQDINTINEYFRNNYLDKICKYDRQKVKNFLFSTINWAFIFIHYTFTLLAIATIWVIIWIVFDLFWRIYHVIRR